MVNKKILLAVSVGATMLAACSEEITVNEVNIINSVSKGEKRPDCTQDNSGEMLFRYGFFRSVFLC